MVTKTILYIAMSEDGFIAGENDSIDFLNEYQAEGEDYGYSNFINSVGSIVVGRKTYEKVKSMGYPYHDDKQVYVITRSPKESRDQNLTFYNGDLKALIEKLKQSRNKHIYCDGGAELVKHMLKNNLIDRLILSIIPRKLYKGTLLFEDGVVPNFFALKKEEVFDNGLIQRTFEFT